MSKFYHRALTDTLKQRIDEQLSAKPDDQISLFEELALVREAASRHVMIYDAALKTDKQESILAAAELMAVSLQRVAEVCRLASTVHAVQKDKFSIHDLNFIIDQIIRISHDVIGDEALAHKLALALRTQLQLTDQGVKGTTLTTDDVVKAMDASTCGQS